VSASRFAALAGPFGRDLDACLASIERAITAAREAGVTLLALPEAALGGYLADLSGSTRDQSNLADTGSSDLPPALELDAPVIRKIVGLAGDMVVCVGFCEARDGARFNSAAALHGDGVLGVYRKVHQPLREDLSYSPGGEFTTFDTPVGRMGMLICYDKAFPEAARSLSLAGAEVVACLSAWPASRTAPADTLPQDRWTRRFDLFDQVRALENQIVWLASNQSGTFGSLRFVSSAKVVGPGGDILATTGVAPGLAVADVDVTADLEAARRSMFHLRDRRPEVYRTDGLAAPDDPLAPAGPMIPGGRAR
jgi:predicted amidohydrolase